MKKSALALFSALLCLGSASSQANVFADQSGYAHVRYGSGDIDNAWYLTEDQRAYRADIERVRELGFSLQLLRGNKHSDTSRGLEYGLDINLGYVHDHRPTLYFYSGEDGGNLRLESNSRFRSAEIAAGAFIGVRPVSWARAYVAAGPGLYWGRLNIKGGSGNNAVANNNGSGGVIIIDRRNGNDDWRFGVSARAGVDLLLPHGIILGAGVRHTAVEFDFGDAGEVDLSGAQFFVALGSRF